jgi:hypothetical protein
MTLLYVQGFEGFSSTGDRTDLDVEFDLRENVSTAEAGITTSGRVTGQAGFISNGNNTNSPLFLPVAGLSSQDDWIVSFAFRTVYNYYRSVTGSAGETTMLQFIDANNIEMLAVTPKAGTFQIRTGTATGLGQGAVLGYANVSLTTYVWHFLEFKVNFHSSTGSYELRINEESVATGSGNTVGTSTETRPAQIRIGNAGNDVYTEIDDLHILDDVGLDHNDFLGDNGIRRLNPDGDGTTTQFTPLGGGTNFSEVDESNPDGDVSYVESNTATQKDTYTFGDITSTPAAIEAVATKSYVTKPDAGSRNFVHVARSTIEEDSAVLYPSAGTYRYMASIFPTDPDGGAWDKANVNAAEFGFKVNA